MREHRLKIGVSGIRGVVGEFLTPTLACSFAQAFGTFVGAMLLVYVASLAVLQAAVAALCRQAGRPPSALLAWLGPCIGPRQFEVGADVLLAFGVDPQGASDAAFVRRDRPDGQPRWLADLPALARQRLQAAGVQRISGGSWCTVEDPSLFFSHRRDASLGRMAAAIACVDR